MLRGRLAKFDNCLVFQDYVLIYHPGCFSDDDMSGTGVECGYQ